jgi:hypothetical protein
MTFVFLLISNSRGSTLRAMSGPIWIPRQNNWPPQSGALWGGGMKRAEELGQTEIVDLLNRCWMAHDGMWFLHCFQTFGIEQANRLNKSAIRSLAPLEVAWIRKALGDPAQKITDAPGFKRFFESAARLVIPEFMGARMVFSAENRLQWEFEPLRCFAYRGMKRLGALEGYECGVIYRLECWLEALGLSYEVSPRPVRCRMLVQETCSGEFIIRFPSNGA